MVNKKQAQYSCKIPQTLCINVPRQSKKVSETPNDWTESIGFFFFFSPHRNHFTTIKSQKLEKKLHASDY